MSIDANSVVDPFTVAGESKERIERELDSEWDETVRPIKAKNPVTMWREARVRPQCLVLGQHGELSMLYSSYSKKEDVTINTCLARSSDGGTTWRDDPSNPVLDRIESHWQGPRAFGTGLGWDTEGGRWVMASVGAQPEAGTPGIRAAGFWFSQDLTDWTQAADNPVITSETDPAGQERVLPDDAIPAGVYVRHLHPIDGTWHALVNWRLFPDEEFTGNSHPEQFYRHVIMKSEGDVTGPWKLHALSFDPESEPSWITATTTFSQPFLVDGCWYAACKPEFGRVGFVYSEDYISWHAVGAEAITPPLQRSDGTSFNPSQQYILPSLKETTWRGISGARGNHGDKYAYLFDPA